MLDTDTAAQQTTLNKAEIWSDSIVCLKNRTLYAQFKVKFKDKVM